jgi:ABC-2 type transport system ATP-binding protein
MIEVKSLGKRYGTLEAVRGVSFDISKGEVVGLLGPNGAGKTTIMKILTCFLYPSSGTARVNGCDIFEQPLEIKRSVGYLPENAPLYTDLNVMEYLDFIAEARSLSGSRRKERVEWVIEECGLKEVLYRSIDKLSKGYRQRTGLAQAIIHDPEILILDEPTTGLDPNQIIEIRELIRRHGQKKTVILSTHILQEVEATCGRVLILNEGQIAAQGTTAEIQRGMQGEVQLALTVKGRAYPSAAGVPGIRQILRVQEGAAGTYQLELALDPDGGAEEKVFDWAVGQGYKILAMVPRRLSLEDIFIKLTRENN